MAITELIEFIDAFGMDDELYWQLSSEPQGQTLECHWVRKDRSKPWRLRSLGSNNWHHFTTREVAIALTAEGIQLKEAQSQFGNTILSQAIFADHLLKSACQVLGAPEVEQAIRETQAFLAKLKKTVHDAPLGSEAMGMKSESLTVQKLRLLHERSDEDTDDEIIEDTP